MRTLIAGLGLLLIASAARGQQHAPTMDVCTADLAVWYDTEDATDYLNQETKHMNDGVRNTSGYSKLSLIEVLARINELGQCWIVSGQQERFHEAQAFYSGIYHDRALNFLRRHNLMKQLKREDAQGIR